jgi:hypothetical protein
LIQVALAARLLGAMYWGVPTSSAAVSVASTDSIHLDTPKSRIFQIGRSLDPDRNRLFGLRSRCTTLAAWAADRPTATCLTNSTTSDSGSRPFSRRWLARSRR